MKHDPIGARKRKSVNLSLDTNIVAAARAAGINLSKVSEAAIRAATRKAEEERWADEHRDWIATNNAWVEQHGLPLEKYRMF